jgi:hypothetical protein
MPRSCLACTNSPRKDIDKALIAGELVRNIAEVFRYPPALLRHKQHVAQSIVKAAI